MSAGVAKRRSWKLYFSWWQGDSHRIKISTIGDWNHVEVISALNDMIREMEIELREGKVK